jgi:di/tricarboxylate transporter
VIYLAAVIVLGTLVAMTSGKVPTVLALGTGLAIAGITRVAPPAALFSGLSNGGVITVAAMLVIAKGIMATGVITRVTWRLLSTVGTARQALRRLAVIGTCISLTFINRFSHQSNLMVMDPGGYSSATFARFGLPLFVASVACAGVVGFVLLRG